MKNTLGWIQKHKTEKLFLTFKGFALGMSIVIPGVSAGTNGCDHWTLFCSHSISF